MIRLAIRCRPDEAEFVLAELAVLAPNGVEERLVAEPGSERKIEFAIYGGPGEIPEVGELDATVGGARIEVEATEVEDGWENRWRDFHQPVTVGGSIRIRPPWIETEESGAAEPIDVVVDPGQAFGTGAHSTTRLCLEAMLELPDELRSGPFCDLGTGSGVLAIAAIKLGLDPVVGYDNDPASIVAAGENAAANGVDFAVHELDVRDGVPPLAPVTVANLVSPLLVELSERLSPELMPQRLICSGILAEQADEVAAAFAESGGYEIDRLSREGWVALVISPDGGHPPTR